MVFRFLGGPEGRSRAASLAPTERPLSALDPVTGDRVGVLPQLRRTGLSAGTAYSFRIDEQVTVDCATSGGTAESGTDFTAASGR